jgi:hypothetical protein
VQRRHVVLPHDAARSQVSTAAKAAAGAMNGQMIGAAETKEYVLLAGCFVKSTDRSI